MPSSSSSPAKLPGTGSPSTARCGRVRSFELRSATSTARLLHGQERRSEARGELAAALEGFCEGAGSADVEDARALLRQVS